MQSILFEVILQIVIAVICNSKFDLSQVLSRYEYIYLFILQH